MEKLPARSKAAHINSNHRARRPGARSSFFISARRLAGSCSRPSLEEVDGRPDSAAPPPRLARGVDAPPDRSLRAAVEPGENGFPLDPEGPASIACDKRQSRARVAAIPRSLRPDSDRAIPPMDLPPGNVRHSWQRPPNLPLPDSIPSAADRRRQRRIRAKLIGSTLVALRWFAPGADAPRPKYCRRYPIRVGQDTI